MRRQAKIGGSGKGNEKEGKEEVQKERKGKEGKLR